ncbi:MAG: NOL1/NOP2/sun family putative RNA methylase [candidate division WOR-3 bacterium]|nr:MAG: NOL1/NOP2/sun family putative RNA methylase [candidate division WOR-3 bacterium]
MKIEKLFARYESIVPDFDAFMQYLKKPLVRSFRVNTLKARREQILGFLDDLHPHEFSFWPNAFSVDERRALGNHITHNLGLIYVQEVASMVPVIVLDPQPGEIVLDLCAAPGSKATQIAESMANLGLIVANEVNRKRMRGLIHNIKRCGVMNEVIISLNGQKLYRTFPDYFDRVLVDAPCSAEGTIRKSKAVLSHWGVRNIERMSRIQIGLAVSGFRSLRPGGVMVYSTCTIAPEENEMVISYLLRKFPDAEVLPVRVARLKMRPGVTQWQDVAFDPRVGQCARILPQDNDTAPFFVAKIAKRKSCGPQWEHAGGVGSHAALIDMFADRYGVCTAQFRPYAVFKIGLENFIATPQARAFKGARVIRRGLEFGKVYDGELKPDNDMAQIFGMNATKNVVDMEGDRAVRFLRGEVLRTGNLIDVEKGFLIARLKGLPLGVGRYNGNVLKSTIRRDRRVQ